MMRTKKGLAFAIAVGSSLSACNSCFVRGTGIATSRGARPIEELVPGELVVCWDPERRALVERPVASVRRSTRREIASLRAGERVIRGVTLDHPVFDAATARFVEVGDLSLGSRLVAWRGPGEIEEVALDALEVRSHEGDVEVFDLSIEGPEHDFFADGILAHNKEPPPLPDGGLVDASEWVRPDADSCFAEGTRVSTPEGPRAIESLREGDRVWSWDLERHVAVARAVAKIRVAERDDLVELHAEGTVIAAVTPDHPLYDAERRAFVEVGALTLRSRLLSWVEGEARAVAITSIARRTRRARVFDLTIDGPEHDFFAEGVLVHNKEADSGIRLDAQLDDAGAEDAGAEDAGAEDAGAEDAG